MILKISGRAYVLSIVTDKDDMTVGEVKLQIQNTYLIPADDQLLYFSGILLHNAHLLSSYGIGHHSNLEVVVVQKKNDDHPSSSQDTWDNEEACRGANKAERELRAEIRRMHSEIIRCHGQGRIQDDRQYYSLPVEPLLSPETLTVADLLTELDIDQADTIDGESTYGEEDDSEWRSVTAVAAAAEMTPASSETDPSNMWGSQDLADLNLNEHATTPQETETDIDFFTQELQKACDAVTEATTAKKEISSQINALEKKLIKAYITIQEVSQELEEAVEKVAMETQRLRTAVQTIRTGH